MFFPFRSDNATNLFLDTETDVVYFKFFEDREATLGDCAGGLQMVNCMSFVADIGKVKGIDLKDGNCVGRGSGN